MWELAGQTSYDINGDAPMKWVGLWWLLEAHHEIACRRRHWCRLERGRIRWRLIGRWRVLDDRRRACWMMITGGAVGGGIVGWAVRAGQAVQLGDLEANRPTPLYIGHQPCIIDLCS